MKRFPKDPSPIHRPSSRAGKPSSAPKPPIALTIAGFDPSSGAGITADLQVFAAHNLFGTAAITALTVQSTRGVVSVEPISPNILRRTLETLAADLPPAGIKIGMLATAKSVANVATFLQSLSAATPKIPIVLDPVILSSSGTSLLDTTGLKKLRKHLLARVTWLTPNWQELALLANTKVRTQPEAEAALEILASRYPHLHLIATGGDQPTLTDILRTPTGEVHHIPGNHIETTSTHGTGCAFSSALLSRLTLGDSPLAAVIAAKRYIEGALIHAPGLGSGRGPMNLLWPLHHPAK